jgi:hypothetical protein
MAFSKREMRVTFLEFIGENLIRLSSEKFFSTLKINIFIGMYHLFGFGVIKG